MFSARLHAPEEVMTFQTSLSPVPEPRNGYQSSDLVTPLSDAMLAQGELSVMGWIPSRLMFESAVDEAQNGRSMGRFGRRAPDSPALTLAAAQQRVAEAGVSGLVKVHDGMRERALELRIARAKEEEQLRDTISRADQGFGSQLAIGATGFVVDFADPVNLATMAVPGAGAAKVAYGLTKATAQLGATASKVIVRAGVGAYEGGASAALLEPINYALHQKLGDDYDLVDSLMNVGLGAGAGSALYVLGGAGVDLYRGMRVRRDINVDAYGDVMNRALHEIGHGRPPDGALQIPQQQPQSALTLEGAVPRGLPAYGSPERPSLKNALDATTNAVLDHLDALPDDELIRYSVSTKEGGHTIKAFLGQELDRTLKGFAARKRDWDTKVSEDGINGKNYRPDLRSRKGYYLEFKLGTPSGRAAAKRKARLYERQLRMKSRAINNKLTKAQEDKLEQIELRLMRLKSQDRP
jgi:hypothetical protein